MAIINQQLTDDFAVYHSDCMEVLPTLPDRSVGLSIYSPPFPELYQYSDDVRDMTNCVSYQESLDQYRFVVVGVVSTCITRPSLTGIRSRMSAKIPGLACLCSSA